MSWLGDFVDDVLDVPEKVVEKVTELPAEVYEHTERGLSNLLDKIVGED